MRFFLSFCLIIQSFLCLGQIGGSNSFEFLNLRTSPRVIALGGYLTSVFDDDVNKIECTKEHLTKNMADLASRATIINFINDEISKGSLITQISTKDKRVKIIQPSSELIDEFTMWLDMIYKAA